MLLEAKLSKTKVDLNICNCKMISQLVELKKAFSFHPTFGV